MKRIDRKKREQDEQIEKIKVVLKIINTTVTVCNFLFHVYTWISSHT
ncbi:hypothetical protein [Staphylococcus intermedius]|nr:hypothetical protein [Staphylococcus intermedius]